MSNKSNHCIHWLKSSVQSSNNLQDILPLLQIVSMEQIQNFLMDAISKMDTNATRKAYFSTLSIMDTLPNDIMQHIESFISDQNPIAINKKWS
eukprot:231021_1